jgi:hypothetical protein
VGPTIDGLLCEDQPRQLRHFTLTPGQWCSQPFSDDDLRIFINWLADAVLSTLNSASEYVGTMSLRTSSRSLKFASA